MEQSREHNLIKNTMILSVGVFFPKLAVFITLPILTGCLTKTEYGTYDLILTLVSLLLPAATLQIQTAAFRFLIEKRDRLEEVQSIITNIYTFILPISFIVLLILYLLLKIQSGNVFLRLEICIYFMSDLLCGTTRQIARGMGNNLDYARSAFVSSLTQIMGSFFFVWGLDWKLEGAILGLCLGELFAFLFLSIKIKLWNYYKIKCISKMKLKKLLEYSWPMVPNSLSMWVMRVSDRFVITTFLGVTANAVYAVAYKIPSILNLAQSTFNMAWQENASLASKDRDANDYYSIVFRNIYDISAGMMSALIGLTPIIFSVLIRGDYAEAYNQILVLYLAVFFFVISTFWGGLYVAYQRTKSVGVTAVAAAMINLGVDVALIKYIGLYAASGSTLVSYLFLCIFRIFDTRKFVSIKYDYKHIIVVLVIVIGQCIMCAQRTFLFDVINFLIGIIVFISLNKELLISYQSRLIEKLKK